MIRFVSISTFRLALEELITVRRGVYAGVITEICKAFQNASIDEIRSNRDMILMDNNSVVIKLRLSDKKQRLSKADGYRLIYMVLKSVPVVALLTVYPKRGPMQKLDLEAGELTQLLKTFSSESNAQQIVVHDINDNLKKISLK